MIVAGDQNLAVVAGHTMYISTVRNRPFAEQCQIAARSGSDKLSLGPHDYLSMLRDEMPTREMRRIAADAGVRLAHLDPLVRWVDRWEPDSSNGPLPMAYLHYDLSDFFRVASILELESFTATGIFPKESIELNALIDAFGNLCRRAESEGLRCDLEFIPFWGIDSLRCAWDIVHGAGSPNGGIMFDFWHYCRGQRDDDLLSRIPGRCITAVQLDDGYLTSPGRTHFEDTMNYRSLPGEGQFPCAHVLGILADIGGLTNTGLEVMSIELDKLPAQTLAEACRTSLWRMLPQYQSLTVPNAELGSQSAKAQSLRT